MSFPASLSLEERRHAPLFGWAFEQARLLGEVKAGMGAARGRQHPLRRLCGGGIEFGNRRRESLCLRDRGGGGVEEVGEQSDRKSTRLNSSHVADTRSLHDALPI